MGELGSRGTIRLVCRVDVLRGIARRLGDQISVLYQRLSFGFIYIKSPSPLVFELEIEEERVPGFEKSWRANARMHKIFNLPMQ